MPKKPKTSPAVTRTYSPEACFKAMNCAYCSKGRSCDACPDALAEVKASGALLQCPHYDPKARPAGASAAYPIRHEEA